MANSRYPKHEMFFPCIIFHSITFTQQFSCFNLHNIQKKWHFWAKFSLNGAHFGYLYFQKNIYSYVFEYYACRQDFWIYNYIFNGIVVKKWPFFGKFWLILGRLGTCKYPEYKQKNFQALFSFPMTFSQHP